MSKTVEVSADAVAIMGIVADIERYPEWNEGIKGAWVLHRYDDGRPSQVRLDTAIQGFEGIYIHAVYYPARIRFKRSCSRATYFSSRNSCSAWWRPAPTAC
ncbi:hypothetical protein BZL29_5918 [Mycobacterium kansasii]|uniref:Polyketide cyclase / dehydrase and lipid transport family protein n=1 Tax=Mycobacterium kansasii TaxID=1768 RepID=A0A1V3WVR6_MYCKA|nr:hypothetical protein BZL29_5918 [Mycobacterium kansasii]